MRPKLERAETEMRHETFGIRGSQKVNTSFNRKYITLRRISLSGTMWQAIAVVLRKRRKICLIVSQDGEQKMPNLYILMIQDRT